MQSVSGGFTTASLHTIRRPVQKTEISWTKDLDPDYTYFTIGVSEIGGTDIIPGIGSVPNEFDYFDFIDESGYVESIEIDRYFEQPVSSVARAALDIVLNNISDRFSPDGGSAIAGEIKPNRPVRVSIGFAFASTEYVVLFEGQIAEFPELDTQNKTVSLFGLDLIDVIANQTIDESELLVDKRIDEILDHIMEYIGIDSANYDFDTGATIIPYLSFQKGDKIGKIIRQLMQAEGGVFWVDETGKFRFLGRDAWNTSPYNVSQITLDDDLVLNESNPDVNSIINVCEVIAKPRALQNKQGIWSLQGAREIQAGETVEFWATFVDPSRNVDPPAANALVGSYFKAGVSSEDQTGSASSYLNLDTFYAFTNSATFTVTNNSDSSVWLTELVIFGEPAKVTKEIYQRVEDTDSIAIYGERLLRIENDYIQTDEWAYAMAKMIVEDRKDLNSFKVLKVRGLPQLQLGDLVTRNSETYTITRIRTMIDGDSGLTQELTLQKKTIQTYFRVGISEIGGDDPIAP